MSDSTWREAIDIEHFDFQKITRKNKNFPESVLLDENKNFNSADDAGDPMEALTTADSRISDHVEASNPTNRCVSDDTVGSVVNDFEINTPCSYNLDENSLAYTFQDGTSKKPNSGFGLFLGAIFNKIDPKLAFFMLIFVITNSAQPLLICLLRQHGGTPNGTYTFLIPTYVAMICVGIYPTKKSIFEENWRYPIMLSTLDIIHQVIEKAGLIYCGPSIYSIASSTNTMFLAMFAKLILNKEITRTTWLSISLISGSLAVTGIGHFEQITYFHISGFFLVVMAALVNALNSTIGEDLLKREEIEGPNLVCMMGIVSFSAFFVWSCLWTIPQRRKLFPTEGELNPFDIMKVLNILGVLFISNFGRSSVYYYIMKNSGSVSCGVLKAIRIIIVVIGGHVMFSCTDKTQTITMAKVLASVICSTGVIIYSLEKSGWRAAKVSDQ
ncbi:hypothetical protein BEWA_010660 [Theileria equi strain WA]|uniref:Sugar phosphate transporter domain-containing protein n=1 Tax=Theileria equi strain WA TaxID=1537102 RepID=L0B3E8_THEEQ|nr:hypothetical protein BEWA_010660 [Theileria equi strain WA]AFZ81649.1 hypothetical protein BEWA_010660 [Theileria equi strain WA]|eukprot:XP_004831315.1 hypothetical protein BEWA_010660 [Theileria equi strain WA]